MSSSREAIGLKLSVSLSENLDSRFLGVFIPLREDSQRCRHL
jgi:hypothetical protein